MTTNLNARVPVICTRGIVVFPGQDVMIEVGRPKSLQAINDAQTYYDSVVFIVCQIYFSVTEHTAKFYAFFCFIRVDYNNYNVTFILKSNGFEQ